MTFINCSFPSRTSVSSTSSPGARRVTSDESEVASNEGQETSNEDPLPTRNSATRYAFLVPVIKHPLFLLSIGFGFALGMGMASKINAAAMAIVLPLAFFVRWLVHDRNSQSIANRPLSTAYWPLITASLIAGGLACIISFRIFQPYAFDGLMLNKEWIAGIAEQRAQATAATDSAAPAQATGSPAKASLDQMINPLKSRSDIAKAARLSSSQVLHIEKIQKQAAPELVAAVKAGAISLNAAAAVASLSAEEQKTAAQGGKVELKLAAKRVREELRKPVKEDPPSSPEDTVHDPMNWQQRVQELTAENDRLRQEVGALRAQLGL